MTMGWKWKDRYFSTLRLLWTALALVVTLAVAVGVAVILHETSRAVRDEAARMASQAEVKFVTLSFDRAWTPPSGFESVSSPAVFSDAALFQGRLYLCGPGGLFAYDSGGALTASYRVGLELPAAPLARMATGIAAGSSRPELFIATAGEGLLEFDGQRFRQVRPFTSDDRTLTALLPLSTGRILMGTPKHGVLVYDGRKITVFHPALAGVYVTALAGDESSVWVGTLDRGVWHWHAGEVDRFSENEGLPDSQVLAVAVLGDRAWAGTAMGVGEFRGGRFTRVLGSGVFVSSLLPGVDALVVGTEDGSTLKIPLSASSANRLGQPRFHDAGLEGGPKAGALLDTGLKAAATPTMPGPVLKLTNVGGGLQALSENGVYALGPATLSGEGQRTGGSCTAATALIKPKPSTGL